MAKKVTAYLDRNGKIYQNESDADKNNIALDLIEVMDKLDIFSAVDEFDITKSNLEELVRIGRMAEKYLSL